MKISEIQQFVSDLIEAHPKFKAANVVPILDDGTYPKLPGLENALSTSGLAIIVWRLGCAGMVDTNKTGASNQLLHIAVVIQENATVNRGAASEGFTPTGILPEDAYQYVSEAVSGKPAGGPPGTPILPFDPPFENLGKVNGVLNIVVDFTKQHRITPI
ncbi:MAG: hypothetical protein JWR19_2162 [Pedosphaera sp.]|nr:hypothetical protein [Pedosphaera sp.]